MYRNSELDLALSRIPAVEILGYTNASIMLRLLASALLFGAAVRAMITLDEAVAFMKGTDALNGTETAAVTGQYLALDGFDAAFITNASHLLVAINMTHALDDCGYAAIGFGTSMSDSAMAIMCACGTELLQNLTDAVGQSTMTRWTSGSCR